MTPLQWTLLVLLVLLLFIGLVIALGLWRTRQPRQVPVPPVAPAPAVVPAGTPVRLPGLAFLKGLAGFLGVIVLLLCLGTMVILFVDGFQEAVVGLWQDFLPQPTPVAAPTATPQPEAHEAPETTELTPEQEALLDSQQLEWLMMERGPEYFGWTSYTSDTAYECSIPSLRGSGYYYYPPLYNSDFLPAGGTLIATQPETSGRFFTNIHLEAVRQERIGENLPGLVHRFRSDVRTHSFPFPNKDGLVFMRVYSPIPVAVPSDLEWELDIAENVVPFVRHVVYHEFLDDMPRALGLADLPFFVRKPEGSVRCGFTLRVRLMKIPEGYEPPPIENRFTLMRTDQPWPAPVEPDVYSVAVAVMDDNGTPNNVDDDFRLLPDIPFPVRKSGDGEGPLLQISSEGSDGLHEKLASIGYVRDSVRIGVACSMRVRVDVAIKIEPLEAELAH